MATETVGLVAFAVGLAAAHTLMIGKGCSFAQKMKIRIGHS